MKRRPSVPSQRRLHRALPNGMSRRRLLGALGLAGAAFLPSLARESRAAAGPPTRLLHLVTSHGTVYDNWKLRVGELDELGDWQLDLHGLALDEFSPILAPLHGVREHLLVLDGLAALGVGLAGTNEHEAGHVAVLTGTIALDILDTIAVATGPSIDQVIAKSIATPGQYPTLQYNVGGWPICFDDFGQPIPYELDVFAAYDRLFPGGQDPAPVPSETQAIRGAQPSVLDLVGEQYAALAPKLSGEDRQKLEQHRALIRGLELQLDGLAALACEAPAGPGSLPEWGAAEYPLAMIQAYLDIVRVALACRLSPVISLRVDTMFNATIGAPPGDIHTDWAHASDDSPDAAAVMTGYHRFHAQWIAGFFSKKAGHRRIATCENFFRIRHAHRFDGAYQQVFSHRHSGFGRAVHRSDQLVHPFALAQRFEQFGGVVQKTGQWNANFFVSEESICFAQQANGCQCTFFERGLES